MKKSVCVGLVATVIPIVFPPMIGLAARPLHAAASGRLYRVDIGAVMPYAVLRVNKFLPDKLTIHAGDSVQWTNRAPSYPQTVTFGPLEATPSLIVTDAGTLEISPRVAQAQGGHALGDTSLHVYSSGALMKGIAGLSTQYTLTFPTPGVYLYRSLFHPLESGEIDVVAAGKSVPSSASDVSASLARALRSADDALLASQSWSGNSANGPSGVQVAVGLGNENVSLNSFIPSGVTIHVGSTVTWKVPETSGDPHAIVMGSLTSVERAQQVPLYTGRTPDGGLRINPDYVKATALSAETVATDTLQAANNHIVSGILYGSGPNTPTAAASSFQLTFMAPGEYDYTDPFYFGMSGKVVVTP